MLYFLIDSLFMYFPRLSKCWEASSQRERFERLAQDFTTDPIDGLSALSLRRDPHGSVKQIHHEELEDGDNERPSAFPKIMLKQTDSGVQQLHGAGERTQEQQGRRRLLIDRPQCEQSERNCACRRVHRQ